MDPTKPILAIFAKRKIRAGAEICISYRGYVEGAISDDSDSDDDTPRPRRRGKPSRKQGGTLAQHNDGVIDSRCYCESPNCDGRMSIHTTRSENMAERALQACLPRQTKMSSRKPQRSYLSHFRSKDSHQAFVYSLISIPLYIAIQLS